MRQITARFILFSLGVAVCLLYACHPKSARQEQAATKTPEFQRPAQLAPFEADSAYSYVQKQVDFGPRVPGSSAHKACADWLIGKMRGWADSVTVQRAAVSARGKSYDCVNIIGHYNPGAAGRILLLAHWDTRAFADADSTTRDKPFDGADDGASGVGVLLEIARQLAAKKPSLGVDILLTDVEDAGVDGDDASWCLGTQYWATQAKAAGYRAQYGILLDMVGGRGSHFFREALTRQYADAQSLMVWNVANVIGYSDYFRYGDLGSIGITDDHTFVNRIAGIPTLDIVALQGNGDFMPWHHTVNDNMQIIDKNTLKAVGQTVSQVLYSNPPY
jgi:hypothetical protein